MGDLGTMEAYHTMTLAIAMVRHRAKIALIHAGTNLPRRALRSLYHAVHGESPRGGPLPTSFANVMRSRGQQVNASLYAAFYTQLGAGETYRAVDWAVLVRAYDLYLGIAQSSAAVLDINQAWALAADFKSGDANLLYCASCHVPYLVVTDSVFGETCPFCSLYDRQ
ncbi:FlhC family transcriptional regulator [uncultured Thiodictyon sp.]|uniref:FlhC family transcriptional regulator n=1 Tax=uncultured Thiodictyon sp. TaxID=1846217 RepID=UPI0025E42FFF|nr:FlhC family transcriptional regulator [uncultured Thiodictyon sp.]